MRLLAERLTESLGVIMLIAQVPRRAATAAGARAGARVIHIPRWLYTLSTSRTAGGTWRFVGSRLQREAVMEYIECSYHRYVTYSLGHVIERVPGLTTRAGRGTNGLTDSLKRHFSYRRTRT